jgi:glycosyltransferase involved in cell wall biosynthesis
MNKLVIVDPNAYGGHNDFCRSLSLLLSGKDAEVIYVNREYKSDNSPYYKHIATGYSDQSFKNKIKSYINIFQQLKILIKKGYVVHFQDITPYMIPIVSLLLLLPQTKKYFYLTLHNIKPHSKSIKSRIEYRLVYLLLCLNAFKKVFYHFEFIKMDDRFVVENIPETVRKKMVFVPHHMFHNEIKNTKNMQVIENENQEVIILFFGAIRRNKGLLEFFSLLNKVSVDTKGITFIVAGEFTEYSESDLMQIIDRSEYKIDIQIENRFVDDQEKEQMFNKAHYILLPYLDDFLAQSGVVMDAYQYKKPLIVSSNPSLQYLVTHEFTGYLYNENNLKPLLEKEIYDQKQYDIYVQNINSVLVNKYSDEQIRKLYMNTYASESVSWG